MKGEAKVERIRSPLKRNGSVARWLPTLHMSYLEVDSILLPWLKRHALHAFTLDREYEVRHIDVVDDAGDRYQIDISEPDKSGMLTVFAGNYERKRKKKAKEYPSNVVDLECTLEEAYSKIMEWVGQAQHTRTPVL